MPIQTVATKVVGTPSGSLPDAANWKKIGASFAFALAGAALVWANDNYTKIDFGAATPVVIALAPAVLTFLQKTLSDTRQTVIDTEPLKK